MAMAEIWRAPAGTEHQAGHAFGRQEDEMSH